MAIEKKNDMWILSYVIHWEDALVPLCHTAQEFSAFPERDSNGVGTLYIALNVVTDSRTVDRLATVLTEGKIKFFRNAANALSIGNITDLSIKAVRA